MYTCNLYNIVQQLYFNKNKIKLNRVVAFTLPDITTHQTATAIKTAWHGHKDRQTD